MQDWPLTTNAIFRRGAQLFRRPHHRDATHRRHPARQLRRVRGATPGRWPACSLVSSCRRVRRVGTFGWNTANHMHGLLRRARHRPRPAHAQHPALPRAIDLHRQPRGGRGRSSSTAPCCRCSRSTCPACHTVRHVLVFDDGADHALPDDPRVRLYADVVADAAELDFVDGPPYREHRRRPLLHDRHDRRSEGCPVLAPLDLPARVRGLTTATLGLTDRDTIMPVVPMFHAMAWGIPYTAFLAGASLAMPGPDLSPAGFSRMIESEKVTLSARQCRPSGWACSRC